MLIRQIAGDLQKDSLHPFSFVSVKDEFSEPISVLNHFVFVY